MSSMDKLLDHYAPILKNLIRYSSAVNAKDINFYKSIESSIRDSSNEINENLIDNMNSILLSASTATPDLSNTLKFKSNSNDENYQILSKTLDSLLEKVEINLDNHYKLKNNNLKSLSTKKPTISSDFDDGYTYLDKDETLGNTTPSSLPKSNPNMEKPQTKFLEPVNNFETTPFKPLIKFKPNALKPLDESLTLIDATDEIPQHYENPYFYEIMNQEYPEWILNPVEENESYKSIPWVGSPLATWIDSPEQLDDLLIELNKCKVIAIDLEHHDYRTYHGITSLMQITTDSKKDYLIDPLSPKLRPHLTILNEPFTNPSIIKVLHGAFMDVIWLQRDLGLYLVSLFDTFHASKQLGLGKYSLAFLLEEYAKFRTSKKWQLADWRIRPLSNEMRDYAKADTHFLIEIFYKIHGDLLKIPNALQKTLYASRKVATRRFEYSTYRPKNLSVSSSAQVVTTSGSVSLNDNKISIQLNYNKDLPWTNLIFSNGIPLEKRPLLEILYKWRDNQARINDESSRYIMSDYVLVSLVNHFNVNFDVELIDVNLIMTIINNASKFGGSSYVRKLIKELTQVIKDAVIEIKKIDFSKILVENDKSDKVNDNSTSNDNVIDDDNEENDIYESVKDVNKLQVEFNNFFQFYNENIHNSNGVQKIDTVKPTDKKIFAIEYDNSGKPKTITSNSLNERVESVTEYFQRDMNTQVEFEIDNEIIESEPEEETVEIEEDTKPVVKERDEIITLRKNVNAKSKKRKAEEITDISVDFNKSIMGEQEDTRNRRGRGRKDGKEKKKPSFDPYSREVLDDMNIPQLKKKKIVDRGKNIIFKKK